ncbi:MAG TPA: Nif3-like dinuclear metal center hexameric protein, partial [Candidatus Hydrogenedentes bacterium]|nr:Nif3-like dinuclear metal center hexameric protein [Candidatus Hydrogenedentota bacterium]
MNVHDIAAVLERLAPSGLAYEWDRVGLSIGDPNAPVDKVLVALTVTRGALDAARQAGADLIVSHHPVIWRPLDALRTNDPETRLCLDLVAAGIACYAVHTNLDVAPRGINAVLARRLGLGSCEPLLHAPQATLVKLVTFVPKEHVAAVREAVCGAGAGTIGDYTCCTFASPGVGTFLPGADAQPYTGQRGELYQEKELRFETVVAKARLGAVVKALIDAHPYEEVAYDVLSLANPDAAVGLGMRGELDAEMTLEGFARRACDALELPHVR